MFDANTTDWGKNNVQRGTPTTKSSQHRVVAGGIGHNLPQEAPRTFAEAIVDVVSYGN